MATRGAPVRAVRVLGTWNALVFLAWAAGPFLAVRDALWPRGWAYLVLVLVCVAGHRAYIARRNPELLRRRRRIGAETKIWGLWWNALFWPLMAAIAIAAGLDARRGAPLPAWTFVPGAAVLATGLALSAAAFVADPFFEGTVRIQAALGQHPVDVGPYRRIRHPGYAGLILWALASPLALGSAPAFCPAVAAAAWVVLRTALEDATLQRELPGYVEYAQRVRWRLLPGLW
jgi:protein-S-isoprenylcysteine O-methyltransferase Ste14